MGILLRFASNAKLFLDEIKSKLEMGKIVTSPPSEEKKGD